MADLALKSFALDPDQESRRAELTAFFGPNPAKFLKAYDEQRALQTRQPGEKIKFSLFNRPYIWPAFFLGPVWFFYRKMWLWASIITAAIIIIGLTPLGGRIGLPVGVALAGAGAQAYLQHAVKTIQQLRAITPGGVLSAQQLAQAGGVSKTAGWIGGILYALLTLLGILGIVLAARTGAPLPR